MYRLFHNLAVGRGTERLRCQSSSRPACVFMLLAAWTVSAAAKDSASPGSGDHWSFQPLERPALPTVSDPSQVRNPVDRFILARLEAKGLRMSPEADRATLIRRLSFDLTGLPPTPEEVDAFVDDTSPKAYERLVDRLLASPAYGERWAQHWLDVARFAESDGFEHDKVRKDAWRYRDWVIGALNDDLPFDKFVQWQIAGDELASEREDAALATGFLLCGPDMPDINSSDERRHIVLNEMTSTIGAAFLGLTLNCAQCHTHKYDPITHADFYRLRAFFENIDFPKRHKQLDPVFAEEDATPPDSFVMLRGDFRSKGEKIAPGFPSIANPMQAAYETPRVSDDAASSMRRKELALWLSRPDHPLTLRVTVNRLWMHHFGKPLVATPNDFGTMGEPPTHPELLDWLATELPRRNWSLKAMHRLLVTSAAWRQASTGSGAPWDRKLAEDPDNRLLSRMNRHRLSGEALRDAMLHISGRLNPKRGGPGFRPPLPEEVTVTLLKGQWPVTENRSEHYRRSIYLFARRNLRFPMFDVFDRPDALASCARRSESTTAPQSLALLNSRFTLERSRDLADSIAKKAGDQPTDPVRLAYRKVLGRGPTANELELGRQFLSRQTERIQNRETDPQARPDALTDLCLALFNLNAFVYVD